MRLKLTLVVDDAVPEHDIGIKEAIRASWAKPSGEPIVYRFQLEIN